VVLFVHRRRLSGADIATIDRIAQNAVVALSGDPANCAAAESLDVGLLGSDPVSAAVALALGHLGARRSTLPEPVTERELRIPRRT
jgi:sulfite reductase beta subunit-like hemoprotein